MKPRSIFYSLLLVAALSLSACEFSVGSTQLDVAEVESQITAGLEEQIGVTAEVECPEEVEIEEGATFECDVTAEDGETGTVEVTQEDDEGNVRWELVE